MKKYPHQNQDPKSLLADTITPVSIYLRITGYLSKFTVA